MAPTIPEDIIRRIKNAANIVDVVSDSIVLKNAGKDYKGLCPFHSEKTPSFTVSPEKQIFYCFGCHTGGNVFSFLMQQEGLTFPEAVRAVAKRYGIEVPDRRLSPEQKRQYSQKEKLFRINEIAMAFFRATLNNNQTGHSAMTYLLGRGMTRKVMDNHKLGYAPNRWDGLLRHLQHKKVPVDLLEKSGLVIPRKDRSGFYDRFRDRVIFPILNLNKQVIGFGGRLMGDGEPKYLNSPETLIYNKRKSLYAIHEAKQTVRSTGTIYLTEGYFDALSMHLYGIKNTVATLGTALTAEHVQLLKGMVGPNGKVILVYDSDQAGIKAAERSIAVFEQGFLDAHILVLPKGYDPDDFLKEHGPDELLRHAKQALGMIPFLMESAIQRFGLSVEGKVKVVAALQGPLVAIQDTIARSLYIKQLAERLNIDEKAIMEKICRISTKAVSQERVSSNRQASVLLKDDIRLEQQIVAMMLRYPAMVSEMAGRNLMDRFQDEKLKAIALMAMERADTEGDTAADLISMIDDPAYRNLMAKLTIKEQRWDRQGFERLLAQFELRYDRQTKNDLQRQIEAAERDNDMDLLFKLLEQKQNQASKGLTTM